MPLELLGGNVQETTSTTGTGPFDLDGAVSGCRAYVDQHSDGDVVLYSRFDSAGDIEVGLGTFNTGSPNTITPLHPTVPLLYSTNGGGLINWLSGTQNVACGVPAEPFAWLLDPDAAVGVVERTVAWPPEYSSFPITADGKSLVAASNYAAMRVLLSLVVGTNVQAYDADLAAIAALTHSDGHVLQSSGGAWIRALLAAANVSVASAVSPLSGSDVEAVLDSAGTELASHASQLAAGFSKSYTSSAQTIASGGTLTLAHGLGVKPKAIVVRLTCVTNDEGYTAGDTLEAGLTGYAGDHGNAIRTDATNIYVKFGNATNVYTGINLSSGNAVDLLDARWTVQFIAFA